MIQNVIFENKFLNLGCNSCVIVYDIGGTNCNAGLFIKSFGNIKPILIIQYKSHEFTDPYQMLFVFQKYIKDHYPACDVISIVIAAAGFVNIEKSSITFTNLSFVFEKELCKKKSLFNCPIFFMNDFEVIWYGISLIDQSKLVRISDACSVKNNTVGIIGAGTGLGKSIVGFNSTMNSYSVFPSEGGHQAFSVWTQEEYELMNFIIKTEQRQSMITWEDVLSGNGIARIHQFFLQKYPKLIDVNRPYPHPDQIFNLRLQNQAYFETYNLYTRLYARCIREFALEILPFSGIYIAGGIAAHNVDMFKSEIFIKEFLCHQKHVKILKLIPLIVIADYNVSLYGAAWIGFNSKE